MPSMVRHQTGGRQERHIRKTKSFGAWKEQTPKARPTMVSETKANVTIVAVIDIQTMARKMDGERNQSPPPMRSTRDSTKRCTRASRNAS